METISINTSSRSYPIYFTQSFEGLRKAVDNIDKEYSSYCIITDSHVEKLYLDQVSLCLKGKKRPIVHITFEAGENNKTLDTIKSFYDVMVKHALDRKTLIIALGGGVVGDMAGFCASTYMRGVDFVQVPTTLLSQVDSSVGGKTGVDFDGHKNLIGAFYQPRFVYINVQTLKTLPKREFASGMGEVIKHGIIKDYSYFEFLEQSSYEINHLNEDSLIKMIRRSCEIKKSVVDLDEREQGTRALLNFGHTFGHSIERLKNFELTHGECVAIGMHGELVLSLTLADLDPTFVPRALKLMKDYTLPVTTEGLSKDQIYQEFFHDKKTQTGRIVCALIDKPGHSYLSQDIIPKPVLYAAMEKILEDN